MEQLDDEPDPLERQVDLVCQTFDELFHAFLNRVLEEVKLWTQ